MSKHFLQFLLPAGCLLGIALHATGATPADGVADAAAVREALAEYARPSEAAPEPAGNAATPARVELGRVLFFDPGLSSSGRMACATCHDPTRGWSDGRALASGHEGKELARHTPTLYDVAWAEPLFWDGRADTLEQQALGPLTSKEEMSMDVSTSLASIAASSTYTRLFEAAYPGDGVSLDTITRAVAAYQRTLASGLAPFDQWVDGNDQAVSVEAQRGFVLFHGKARCANCHMGWRFTDDGFHDIGLPGVRDRGRAAVQPGIAQLEHAFRTPTLRNITLHAPYMHDGSLRTLAEVVHHYDSGFVPRASLDREMVPLHLTTQEKADLVAFLNTLTSPEDQAAHAVPALAARGAEGDAR